MVGHCLGPRGSKKAAGQNLIMETERRVLKQFEKFVVSLILTGILVVFILGLGECFLTYYQPERGGHFFNISPETARDTVITFYCGAGILGAAWLWRVALACYRIHHDARRQAPPLPQVHSGGGGSGGAASSADVATGVPHSRNMGEVVVG